MKREHELLNLLEGALRIALGDEADPKRTWEGAKTALKYTEELSLLLHDKPASVETKA